MLFDNILPQKMLSDNIFLSVQRLSIFSVSNHIIKYLTTGMTQGTMPVLGDLRATPVLAMFPRTPHPFIWEHYDSKQVIHSYSFVEFKKSEVGFEPTMAYASRFAICPLSQTRALRHKRRRRESNSHNPPRQGGALPLCYTSKVSILRKVGVEPTTH